MEELKEKLNEVSIQIQQIQDSFNVELELDYDVIGNRETNYRLIAKIK